MYTPKIRIGMVGVGFIGQIGHLANYDQIDDCEVVAVADARPQLRKNVCDRYGIPGRYKHHSEMLASEDLDAVVAVTRRHHVGIVANDVLGAGLNLFTEKPMAATLEQAEVQVNTALENGKPVYSVGYMRRHDAGVELAKNLLNEFMQSGELGPILQARMHCFCGEDYCNAAGYIGSDEPRPEELPGWPIAPDWLEPNLHAEYDNFMNIWCHNINLIRHLFPVTPKVDYASYRPQRGNVVVFDMGEFPLTFDFGEMESNRLVEGLEIVFQKGKLSIELPPSLLRKVPARVSLYRGEGVAQSITYDSGWSWAFKRQAQAFVTNVREKSQPLASAYDSLEDMQLIQSIWKKISSAS